MDAFRNDNERPASSTGSDWLAYGPADSFAAAEPGPVSIPDVDCWRCGGAYATSLAACPTCKAAARHVIRPVVAAASEVPVDAEAWSPAEVVAARSIERTAASNVPAPIVRVIYFFVMLLGLSVVQSMVASGLLAGERNELRIGEVVRQLITGFEIAASILVLFAWLRLPRPPALPEQTGMQKLMGWLWGSPLLAGALAVNLAYHALLQSYVRLPDWMQDNVLFGEATLLWLVLAICVQPAVIEELFFRHLALGHLRAEMGDHAAVWVSSLMFGMAHLGTPLSIPALVVVGVALGYARLWSGSLLLPMIMHAAHNGVVIFLETR